MKPDIALTVDLEDWFHGLFLPAERRRVVEDTDWLLETFSEAGVKATFFVLGEVAEAHSELPRRIADEGHEVAFHGATHRFLGEVGPAAFHAELSQWLPRMAEMSGQAVKGYRAPFFSIGPETDWALPILAKHGIRYDASIYPGPNDRYGWPGAPSTPHRHVGSGLALFPVPTLHRRIPVAYSGGAYLRLLPWRLIQETLHRRSPSMVYVHPWEIAADLPRPLNANLRAQLTRYPGRRRMRQRLLRILKVCRHRLGPMNTVLDGLGTLPDWQP